ncbi:monofunctional biosynthetic peptidoglycan transglycosylase [Bacteroidota bacterium]
MAKRKKHNRILIIILKAVLIVFILTLMVILPFRWIAPPISSFIVQAEYSSSDKAHKEIKNEWIYWEEISPQMPIAVVASEDQNFPNHFGFDFESISEAIEKSGERQRGASTITQQVVKNLYLWPGKSLFRKGIEAYLTLFVELLWPKKRILEVYLNFAEFGPGIYGVEAASKLFWDKPASELTLQEASLLAAVLPNPNQRSPVDPSEYVIERADWIAREVEQLGGKEYLENL